MEIDKILFGQLVETKGIENPFEDFDVNNDGIINEEDAAVAASNQALSEQITNLLNSDDEETTLVDEADFDENEITTVSNIKTNTFYSSQARLALTQLEINKLNDEQTKIQEDITKAQKELEAKQKRIEEKKEELDTLIKEAQNSNDNSKAVQITDLQAEIKQLSSDIEELVSSVEKLESDYKTNSISLTSLSNSLEVQQTVLMQEISEVNSSETVNGITASNEVNATTSTTKKEVKTMEEYKEILDCKFNELLEKFCGDGDAAKQYVKNNLGEFMDVTGDGRIDKLDFYIWDNYQRDKKVANIQDTKAADTITKRCAQEVRRALYLTCGHPSIDTNSYDLEDLENYAKLGANPQNVALLLYSSGNKTKIAQTEDWESKLETLCGHWINGGYASMAVKSIKQISDYIKANPENAQIAPVAIAFQRYSEGIKNTTGLAQEYKASYDASYEDLINDKEMKAAYKDYKKDYPHSGISYEEWVSQSVYGSSSPKSASTIEKELKEGVKNSMLNSLKNTDINGDGKLDVNDITALCTDIDLDGDGQISCEEKSFIAELRETMKDQVYKSMTRCSKYNATNIDDVINYFENFDHDAHVQKAKNNMCSTMDEIAEGLQAKLNDTFGYIPDNYLKNGEFCWISSRVLLSADASRRVSAQVSTFGAVRYMDGTLSQGSWTQNGEDLTLSEAKKLQCEAIEYGSVQYTYLHYVQSADLSKEELQGILNKINSASSAVQSKLADVKKVVETRLDTME